jgi:flagellar biosynthesis protein FlhA
LSAPPAKKSSLLSGDLMGGIVVLGIVALAVLPLPTWMIDVLLGVAICASVLVFLLSMYVERPLDFSALPSFLLLITLFRLALNIATTRAVLLHGSEGTHAAGKVIEALGNLAIGGNFVVGGVVFVILVIINFVVITKGSERISEVSARFTLDSMPGKQMAIDADLGAGLISDVEARQRRKEVEQEADFHGAMDGASKFVRGDAVAGLLIVAINILGGIIIGVAQKDLAIGDAATTYTILTVGDGLVSQIPALLVSVAAGIIASRTGGGGEDLGTSLAVQFLRRPSPLYIASASMAVLAFVPGMPTLAFFGLAIGCLLLARRAKAALAKPAPTAEKGKDGKPGDDEGPITDLLHIDLLSLEVGFDLVPLVDRSRGGELIRRITGIRRQLVPELGIVVPPVHIRDNLRLPSSSYRLLLSGTTIGEGEIRMSRLMAIDPGGAMGKLEGERAKDPAFGMPAVWIPVGDRERAELLGYTVVDAGTVVATHLTEMMRNHASDLLGRAEAQELVDAFAKTNSKLVEEVIPNLLPLGDVIKVLKNLLREGVSIRDFRTILESIADHSTVKDPDMLTEHVRVALARQLTARHADAGGNVTALLLTPEAEGALRPRMAQMQGRGAGAPNGGADANGAMSLHGVDPAAIPAVIRGLERAVANLGAVNNVPLLLTAPDVRRTVAALAARHAPGLAVMSFSEVDPKANVKTVGVVGLAA